MKFCVSIEQFDGPLDLMLHLVKENKLDLFDLDMDVLATQYIDFIHEMQILHLEVASEYLEELASLIEYKSRKLLPREKVEVEEEYEEDKRDQLVNRLLEYQKYKEVSQTLKSDFDLRQQHFTRPAASLIDHWQRSVEQGPLQDQSVYELMRAMERVIKRQRILQPYETKVTIKELSVEERVDQVKARMENVDTSVSFDTLCQDCTDLHMIIVTFLAILDLIHQKWLIYLHKEEDDSIWVMKGNENE